MSNRFSNRDDHPSSRVITLADGTTLMRNDFVGCLEHVMVPHGGQREGYLRKDQEALVTGILVAPHAAGFTPAVPDLGTLVFGYNGAVVFSAPVSALMNRYHGLTSSAVLKNRLRLLFDPQAGFEDVFEEGCFVGALPTPLHFREQLMYEIHHQLPKVTVPSPDETLLVASDALRERGIVVDPAAVALLVKPSALTVELQMLFKPSYVDRSRKPLGLRWEAQVS